MYCQKCGKQIADGSVFCQHCGAQIGNVISDNFSNRNANQWNNFKHYENRTERVKGREEFFADYRAKHPEIIIYFVLFAICILAGSIVFIINYLEFSNHHREENLNGMLISIFFDVGAFVFLYAKRRSDKLAQSAYDTYLNSINGTEELMYEENIDNTSSQRFCENCGAEIDNNAEVCPICGTKQIGKIYR